MRLQQKLQKYLNVIAIFVLKQGIIHHLVEQNQFNLISGKDDLSLYQFGTMTAKHFFVNIAEFIRFITQEPILKR